MSISSPFIKRPIATSLIAAAFFIVGVACYFQLPVSALPQVDFPTIQVSANLPGASPETMASNVATPLERQFSLIQGVTQMTSNSSLGSTQVVLQFDLNRNIDGAAQDVQAAINAAGGQLPTNLPSPPSIRKVNPADAPIFTISLTSDFLPISVVSDYADNVVAQQISRMSGVGLVNISGAQKPAIRIRIDPRRAAALGLQLDTIRAQIAANTVNAPKGQLIGPTGSFTVYANDQLQDAATWRQMIVGYHNGAPVRVKDLGDAVMDVENNQSGGGGFPGGANKDRTLKEGPAIVVLVTKQPGANVIKTVEAIKTALPSLEANVPPGINFHILQDKTQTIRASVKDVEITLMITVALVVGVIFLFLRSWRATLIPSVVIPLALLATTAVMLPLGFSLDNLSLMAMSIAVGFVVDDAIVMVEAIWRRVEHGEPPFQAALNGAKEIGFTILSISISLIAVFTPLMFMGGVVGRLMREFAFTLSAAVILSVILSLTFTPMLCGRFLQAPKPASNWFIRGLETGFNRLETAYAHGLDRVMRYKPVVFGIFLAAMGLAVFLYTTANTGFFPQQDTGFLQGAVVGPQWSSYARTEQKAREVARIVASDPDITEVHYSIGGNVSQAMLNFTLLSRDDGRKASVDEVIARLRRKVSGVVGVQTILQASQDITVGGRAARAEYQYTLSDGDLNELNAWAPRFLDALKQLPEIKDVSSDQQSDAPSVTMVINRDIAGRFGISPADIDAAVYNQIGQRQVAQYFTQLNAYRVVMEAPPALQATPALFSSIYLLSPKTGKPVPLSLLVKIDNSVVRSLSVSHQGQFPAATLSFNLAPGVSLGQATVAVQAARDRLGAPVTLSGSFQGTAAAFQDSLRDEPILITAALLSVYVILGVLYESYIHPLTILSTLPSAGVGAILALKMVGMDLNVIGIIAIILLIGIVKKNGIMIVDVALKLEREQGLGPEEATVRASLQRFRPILMTTACAFLSGLPMVFGGGTGSEFRKPLGMAIVGGLIVSQALTLFTTPVIYVYLDRVRRRFERMKDEVDARRRATTAADLPIREPIPDGQQGGDAPSEPPLQPAA